MSRRRVARLEAENERLRQQVPPGSVALSPFAPVPARSLLPWRRQHATEAGPALGSPSLALDAIRAPAIEESASVSVKAPPRAGFLSDIPRGGATEWNQGYTQVGGIADRRVWMEELQQLYLACPWSAAAVDTIARFCSAGAMDIVDEDESTQRLEKSALTRQAQKAQALFRYVNPDQNFRQLMRMIFTDLLIYGDSFVEVVWALGEPIALYSLPCPDMLILADEHGNVSGYVQRTETNRKATFAPHEVIHIKYDSPRGGLYGIGPTEKLVHPIVTWVSTEGLLKRTMEKGDPPNFIIGHDPNVSAAEQRKLIQQYQVRNLGAQNVGNPVEFFGKPFIQELAQNKLAEYIAVKNNCRDEICGGYGTPPAILSIIESGNLGGGTGSSQFKTFRVNTCGPIEELVLEAFTFWIVQQGFGVTGKRCKFEDVDWRDDEVIENIIHQRITDGRLTINRARDLIGEPPVDGGDDAVIIQTRDVVLVKDLAEMSKAAIDKDEGVQPGPTGAPPGVPTVPDNQGQIKPPVGNAPAGNGGTAPRHAKGSPTEAHLAELTEAQLMEAWQQDVARRRAEAMRELTEARP